MASWVWRPALGEVAARGSTRRVEGLWFGVLLLCSLFCLSSGSTCEVGYYYTGQAEPEVASSVSNNFYISSGSTNHGGVAGATYSLGLNNGYAAHLVFAHEPSVRDYGRGWVTVGEERWNVTVTGLLAGARYKYRLFMYNTAAYGSAPVQVFVNDVLHPGFVVADTSDDSKLDGAAVAQRNGSILFVFDPICGNTCGQSGISFISVARDDCDPCTSIPNCQVGNLTCSNATDQTCSHCVVPYILNGGQTSCSECGTGWTTDSGGPCRQCEIGKYKDVVGPYGCRDCPAGTTSRKGATHQDNCTTPCDRVKTLSEIYRSPRQGSSVSSSSVYTTALIAALLRFEETQSSTVSRIKKVLLEDCHIRQTNDNDQWCWNNTKDGRTEDLCHTLNTCG